MVALFLLHLTSSLAFEIDQLPPKIADVAPVPTTACQNNTPAPGDTPMAVGRDTREATRPCGWPNITEVSCRLLHCQFAYNAQNETVCVKRKEAPYTKKLLKPAADSAGSMPEAAPQGRQAKHTADDVPEWGELSVSTYEETLSNLKLEDKWQNDGWSSLEKWTPPRPPMRTKVDPIIIPNQTQPDPPPPIVVPPVVVVVPPVIVTNTTAQPSPPPSTNPPCQKPEKVLCHTKYGIATKVEEGETRYDLRVGPDAAGHAPHFDVERLDNLTETSRGAEKVVEFPRNYGWSAYGGNPWTAIPEPQQPEKMPQPEQPEKIAPGGNRDAHRCLTSAGFSWCESKKQCVQSWVTPCTGGSTDIPPPTPSPPPAAVETPSPVLDGGSGGQDLQYPTPTPIPTSYPTVGGGQ